jgi:hypothetical protein
MRYPLWAFFFVFVLPPFTAHALLVGKANVTPAVQNVAVAELATASWSHSIVVR